MKHVEFGTRNVTPWPFTVQYGVCVPVLKLEPCVLASYTLIHVQKTARTK